MFLHDGRFVSQLVLARELKETPDNAPLIRDSLTCFDYNFDTNVATIAFIGAYDSLIIQKEVNGMAEEAL